jgi:hypothetical protein
MRNRQPPGRQDRQGRACADPGGLVLPRAMEAHPRFSIGTGSMGSAG